MCKGIKVPNLVKLITSKLSNPAGYGRVVINNGVFDKIVEEKDCNSEQLEILTINGGIYCINSRILCKYLPYLKNENNQKEFYLTDIIEIIKREENIQVGLFELEDENKIEIIGVNTFSQLKELESLINKKN